MNVILVTRFIRLNYKWDTCGHQLVNRDPYGKLGFVRHHGEVHPFGGMVSVPNIYKTLDEALKDKHPDEVVWEIMVQDIWFITAPKVEQWVKMHPEHPTIGYLLCDDNNVPFSEAKPLPTRLTARLFRKILSLNDSNGKPYRHLNVWKVAHFNDGTVHQFIKKNP